MVRRVFDGALGLPPPQREAYIVQESGGNAEVVAQVRELLSAHSGAGTFLESSPVAGQVGQLNDLFCSAADPFADALLKNRYRVRNVLGEGGFGRVYRALDEELEGREVVVKTLRSEHSHASAAAWFGKRFLQEKQALARVDHSSVVGVLDAGEGPGGVPFLVMQYVRGSTLRAILSSGPLDHARVWRLTAQLAGGLDAAHAVHVLHRDVKPENVIVRDAGTADEVAVLIDFGIARTDPEGAQGTTAFVAGSPPYMAPEQVLGRAVPASDQYSLALLVFELLTGTRLPERDTSGKPAEAVAGLLEQSCPRLPASSARALTRALAPDPSDRFATVTGFAQNLLPPSSSVVRRRTALLGYAASVLAGGGFVFGLRYISQPAEPGVKSSLIVRRNRQGRAEHFDATRESLRSGEEISLTFEATSAGHLYLINESAASTPTQPRLLLVYAGVVGARQRVRVPETATAWIRVSGTPGVEKVWALWAPRPVPLMEELRPYLGAPHFGVVADSVRAHALLKQLQDWRAEPHGQDELMLEEIGLRHE